MKRSALLDVGFNQEDVNRILRQMNANVSVSRAIYNILKERYHGWTNRRMAEIACDLCNYMMFAPIACERDAWMRDIKRSMT